MSSTTLIKQEVKKLGETTSARGIPRVFKSTDIVLQIVWAFAVTAGLTILVWQTTTLCIRYYKWESTTLFTQKLTKSVFPDLTICNVKPLNNIDNLTIWESYLMNLQSAQNSMTCDMIREKLNMNISDEFCGYTWWQLSLPPGLFATLPPFDDSRGDKNLISDCYFYGWDWTTSDLDCAATIQTIWDSNYYKCYRIQVPSNFSQKILGFHAIIYTNEFSPTLVNKVSSDLGDTMSTGIRLAVHSPGTEPDLLRGLNIGPGVETTVQLSMTERLRLQSPYPSQCTNQKFVTNSSSILYTATTCYEVCVQSQVIQQCNCVSGNLLCTEYQMLLVNDTLCGNKTSADSYINAHELNAFRDLYCLSFNASFDFDSCIASCNSPCTEYIYDTSVSTSGPSPSVDYQMAFYETYIANSNFSDKFKDYKPIVTGYYGGNVSEADTIKQLNALDRIQRNFIQLNVIFKTINPYQMVDKPAFPIDSLWAQIGGVLALWLGLTIMNIFEIFECIYMLIKKASHAKQKAENNNQANEATQMSVHLESAKM